MMVYLGAAQTILYMEKSVHFVVSVQIFVSNDLFVEQCSNLSIFRHLVPIQEVPFELGMKQSFLSIDLVIC